MRLKLLPLVFFLALLLPSRVLAAFVARPIVASPKPGQALQGVVTIKGSTNISNFQSAEVSFRYDRQDNSSWFLLQQSSQPVDNGALATWDTTTIADDTYRLRVVVTLQDGSTLTTEVPGLRVRNYTAVETSTPAPTSSAAQSVPLVAAAGTLTVFPTPTDLPANPAQVSPASLTASAAQGGLFTAIIFMCIGGYLLVRSVSHRR
ncbi:MAG: hypothetical protein P4L50_30865 [Anaerolineaceae bacterium]|nr:hypothetical protein [Anaerolineaceae bacterium]